LWGHPAREAGHGGAGTPGSRVLSERAAAGPPAAAASSSACDAGGVCPLAACVWQHLLLLVSNGGCCCSCCCRGAGSHRRHRTDERRRARLARGVAGCAPPIAAMCVRCIAQVRGVWAAGLWCVASSANPCSLGVCARPPQLRHV
jgi:hypothetical protein